MAAVAPLTHQTIPGMVGADNDTLHQAILKASADDIRAIPCSERAKLADKLLRMVVSFDDEAALVKLISPDSKNHDVADITKMLMTLHREGLLKPVLQGVTNCTRLGPFGFARDFPSKTISDVRHYDRLRAAVVATKSPEVARALDSYGRTEVYDKVARPTGYAELADAVRGGTSNRVTMTVEDAYEPPNA